MSMRRVLGVLAVVLFAAVPGYGALTTRSVADGLTPEEVATILTGPGATISNVKITGSNAAIGSFGSGGSLGINSGIVLSTGNIGDASGSNDAENSGADLGEPGHYTLDPVVSPYFTHDAMVLEFDVVTVSPTFAISYVFGSEEYREFVGTPYNDVFAFFVNGANIALAPGTNDPVTVNTINHLRNSSVYRDNDGSGTTELDGYTTPLLAVAVVEPGVTQHIRIAIADVSDGIYDSAVFIREGGISGSALAPVVIPDRNNVAVNVGETIQIPLALYYTTIDSNPNLSTSNVAGVTSSFSPLFLDENNILRTVMTLNIGPDTPAGAQTLVIRSAAGAAEDFTTVVLNVDCRPPSILGIGQPLSGSVTRGSSATISVTPQGSGPFTYQWYAGFTGMTGTPIVGGTTATFRTPAVNDLSMYWVRVSNGCGTVDSNAAFLSPQ